MIRKLRLGSIVVLLGLVLGLTGCKPEHRSFGPYYMLCPEWVVDFWPEADRCEIEIDQYYFGWQSDQAFLHVYDELWKMEVFGQMVVTEVRGVLFFDSKGTPIDAETHLFRYGVYYVVRDAASSDNGFFKVYDVPEKYHTGSIGHLLLRLTRVNDYSLIE